VDDGDEVAPAPAGTGCTDPATGPDPACFAQGSAVNVVRQLCDYQFLPGVCDHAMFAHGPTGYATDSDPSPDRPFFLAVGAVHEHSSYSDGDPEAIPADYFRAGRTGVNGTGKGVKLDFMFSSEHSDNEKLPITTSAACLSPTTLLDCNHAQDPHHYFKWQATLEQAMQESSYDEDPAGGFTGIRGFEWTNDYYNHLNVYFSTNVVNVKVDGSYVSMDFFWNWLRKPVAQGGGADALVTFNHPGGDPKLTPFDGGQPHNELLQQTRGGSNWNDLEYIPDVDRNVVGIEVNGGDDIEWYVKALDKGWHVGPVAAEDEHGRNWSSHDQDKTLILTRGRSPRDYYWAFKNRRTVSLQDAVIERGTGGRATHPEVYYWADGPSLQEGAPLGSILRDPGAHVLHVDIRGVPAGTRVALISNTTGGQAAPIELGSAGAEGRFMGTRGVSAPASGEDWYFVVACAPDADNTPACGSDQNYWIVTAPIWFGPGGSVAAAQPDYGDGLLGALAQYFARLHGVVVALVSGDPAGAGGQLVAAVTEFIENLAGVAGGLDPQNPGTTLIGLQDEPQAVVEQALSAAREVEPVVLTGERIPAWSVPAAQGLPYPYPSGAATTGEFLPASLQKNGGRSAHNGQMVYPLPGAPMGVEVARIAAYKYENGGFVEIPVQVDQKFPHFLANSASDFSTYSGTDEELTYQWDSEKWNAGGEGPNAEYPAATPDPVTGLDHDDEVVFMARDAGTSQAPPQALPTGDADFDAAGGLQEVVLADPLDPATPRFVYLGLKKPGKTSAFAGQRHYVQYERDDNADQWIDRRAYCDDDPEKIGTSNTGYGPNRRGPVYYTAQGCGSGPTTVDTARRESDDRFPRDGLTVSTDTYRWYASGRWMVRELQIRDPDNALLLGPDLIDRWKGRAFQQSPDSTLSLVGFEDEQVNWEANSTLLGERCGPVRCIREVWGADSGTNVTKTETFYRDAITYRYRVRVHPIPPDGLYTSWDYNRSAMLPAPGEDVPAGRYFTALRPQGVPIDGVNDDVGQVDGIVPVAGQCITPDGLQPPGPTGLCPAFFDAADPSFNLPLAFNNWEQVSGKGRSGSLVYLFELKGPTSLANPLVVPYYRDDACLDDGTGDDPVPRPWPGESYTWNGGKVPQAYDARAGRPLDHSGKTFADCLQRQGAHGAHGIHYFATHDTDNLFVEGKPLTEIDGQQWQFMVPTERPRNVGDHYANVVRAPLQAVVVPRPGSGGGDVAGGLLGALERWGDALLAALGQLGQGNVLGAFNAVFGGAQQFVADLLPVAAQQLGQLAGLALTPPGAEAVDNPAPEPLMAGVARGVLKVPVGAPLGGYLRPPVGGEYIGPDPVGELADNIPAMADGCDPEHPESCPPLVPLPDELRAIHSPYATYSPPSRGYYDSLITKAVALHDGHDYLVLVKTDLIGMLDEVVQDVKAEVRRRTGIELGDGLIMSATHTHDGPGAVANHSTRYFWLAMDAYQHDLYRRMVPQLADVVVAALEDMKPARIGHGSGTEIEGLNGYRRGRLASYDIDKNDALRRRIGVLRVDDAATGEPRAVVINWAAHGIAFDVENQYFSGDVLGAVERETEQLMNIPVAMLVQSVGGDVSPRGVSNDNKLQRIESYGRRLAPQVKAIAEAIPAQNIQTAPDLRSVSQRLILNRERLGYAAHEYPYPWGAGQCGNDIAVPFADVGVKDIPGYDQTGLPVKNPFCLPSPPPDPVDLADNGVAENGAFYPQDSILYAAQIGAVKLLAQPGEPLVEYGVRLLDMAEGFGHARDDVFVWGYAGDHVGYILPPEEVDWATFGGAESTTTFWGWKQGQRFLDVSRALLQALDEGSAPPPHEFQVNYGLYKQLYEATPPAPVTPSLLPGAVVEQPSDIRRFEATRFVFEGGDPVLDFPSVLMERETTPGIWAAVTRANGEPLDTFFEMHLKYRLVSARHLWTVEFEAPKDWPTGNYRFVVSGQALQAGETPYTLTSDSFTVSISSTLQISSPASNNGNCEVTLSYTPRPDNYRVIDPYVPANQPAPVRAATVTFSLGGTPIGSDDSATISGLQASYSIPGACPTGVSASAVDSYGNTTPGGSGGG
ncbi:MAG TPA: neutral/alkaline non-lysosomal ceramidase N-terminal domain-containing protein, partial [Nevskiales bacterium]|nr:neutral/alkaline non-lysosomal ceramidase N-terminal domain-containing protein [Nevskiales bacterium]